VRYALTALALTVAILAGTVVASLMIDLGPRLRELGEARASDAIDRPVRFGRLSIHLLRGRVVVEDFLIEGRNPGDRPFFTAGRLSLGIDWLTLLRARPEFTITSVEMTDWNMLVEQWASGSNFPRFGRDEEPAGPSRVKTTLRYLRAWRGRFVYLDHQAPWSILAPNIDLSIKRGANYHGTARFHDGVVNIQHHQPMWAHMETRFVLDGPRVRLEQMEIRTDGAETMASGVVDFSRWPEQTYSLTSRVQFQRMKAIFFHGEPWNLEGDADFTGTFHLFKGGHDLVGRFEGEGAGVNAYRFPGLFGSLRWTNEALEVWDAGAGAYGGDARFRFSIRRAGDGQPRVASFDAKVAGMDLAAYTDVEQLRGLRFAGDLSGRVQLEWPLGRFAGGRGDFLVNVTPPAGVVPVTASLGAAGGGDWGPERREWGPFAPIRLPAHLPIAGEIGGRFDEHGVEFDPSRFVTERTHVAFEGVTAWGDRSRIAFHVTSRDWQESDSVLAGLINDFGGSARPVTVGGRGTFDGVMTGRFRRPRIEGTFEVDDLRAFDTLWGRGGGHVVIENGYVEVAGGLVRLDGSEIRADGLFSIGYPRGDGGQEMDARFHVVGRDVASLRHAFRIDDYPVSGALSGEFHLTGRYEGPTGFGRMQIDDGAAWREPFERASASLRFDGEGVRLDGIEIAKGGAAITGAAFVGWDGTYSFNADGPRIPVEAIEAFQYGQAPLSGIAQFTASGSGRFEAPRYDVKFRVADLFVGDEGVGQVTGSLLLRDRELSGEIDAASPRLALTGTGRLVLTPAAEAELAFRFHDSSLDPYVRLFEPRLSPFTTAVASGSIRVVGSLTDIDRLLVDGIVDTVDLRLFDYGLRNAAPIRIALDRHEVVVRDLQLVGEETRLRVSGAIGLHDRQIALRAQGDANLGILQGFFRDVRGSGRAELTASIDGPLAEPAFSGRATITRGRVRHMSLPNSLDNINGAIRFDARGIRLDELTATMGGGPVQFGGRIGFDGYMPDELDVTARGRDLRLRYPEDIRSVVDADLSVRGNVRAPTLGGAVTVKSAVYTRRIDTPGSLFDLFVGPEPPPSGGGPPGVEAVSPVPVRFDVQIRVPSTFRVDTNMARLVVSADLTLGGTYDRPVLLGHSEIDRGEVSFEGKRYRVTRGSMDFNDPARLRPFVDLEAETNVRVPGQTYRVTVSAAGTPDRLNPKLDSDPPLPTADVVALLLSDVQRTQDAEIRALRAPNQTQEDILKARATQALTSPFSSEVGKVVEQTFGVDTFQLTPSFIDPYRQTSRLSPTARVTIGKRISDRAYLTFSRSLNTTFNDQIIMLEYDASDRWFWLISRNEDEQSYAVEVRVRHSF
jgi:hypothetical protein